MKKVERALQADEVARVHFRILCGEGVYLFMYKRNLLPSDCRFL